MFLAGIQVDDLHLLTLASMLRGSGFDGVAERLEDGFDRDVAVVALTIEERDAILEVLVDPDGLGDLRAVLVQQLEWLANEAATGAAAAETPDLGPVGIHATKRIAGAVSASPFVAPRGGADGRTAERR